MLRSDGSDVRAPKSVLLDADFAVVGGGLAGVCTAITAARAGIRVVLIQDRPVLGGNASSEVRLWALGATSHQGNNNRWSREGGVIDELLVENTYRNPEGNPLMFDALLLEKVVDEPNITLLLNTAVFDVTKHDADTIASVRGFCSQNSTMYTVSAPLFCDASGDGIVGFCAGAAFRMGAEGKEEFDERFAPSADYGQLLGHSLYFYSKDAGRPVEFTPPSFALQDITRIPRYRNFNTREYGCQLWWIEYGGRLDTVHETENIKWELWRIVYGVWNHIKNSGQFPEARNLTLEWVGTIPGKRESRRFEGDYMLHQRDLVEQRRHSDAVSFGGWAIDLHPADGVFSEKPGCNQWHSKGVYQIPYRSLYSRNIRNLFLAGRTISASHVAFGSTRVMLTCAHSGQAVGLAAAMCRMADLHPRDLVAPDRMKQLQRDLLRTGQYIPHVPLTDVEDRAAVASIAASSELALSQLPADGQWVSLASSRAMLLPVAAGAMPSIKLHVRSAAAVDLQCELRTASRTANFTPDVVLARKSVPIHAAAMAGVGSSTIAASDVSPQEQTVEINFGVTIDEPRYVFLCLMANEHIEVATTDIRLTGVMSLQHKLNHRVASGNSQTPPADIGVEAFEFWLPERRPGGKNLAMSFNPPLRSFPAASVVNGYDRPTTRPNAWVADLHDAKPRLSLTWSEPTAIRTIDIRFDTDFDHAMETVLMGHPERVMPQCVRQCRVVDDAGRIVAEISNNHQTRWTIRLDEPLVTRSLHIEPAHPSAHVPASIFSIHCR